MYGPDLPGDKLERNPSLKELEMLQEHKWFREGPGRSFPPFLPLAVRHAWFDLWGGDGNGLK